MHAQYLIFYKSGYWHHIKQFYKASPKSYIVSSTTFIVESVYFWYILALVISTEKEDILGILDLECQEKTHCLYTLLAAIHVITEKKVIGIRYIASILYKTEQIIVLTVDVCSDGQRTMQPQKHRLCFYYFLCLIYYLRYKFVVQIDGSSWSKVFNVKKVMYNVINVIFLRHFH